MRDLENAKLKVQIQVVLPTPQGHPKPSIEILATATADRFSPVLVQVGVGDGVHAFYAEYSRRLTPAERDRVEVRPAGAYQRLPHAPELSRHYRPWGVDLTRYQGYLDERSVHHVAGWVRHLDNPADKLDLEIVIASPEGERTLAHIRANQFSRALVEVGVGDGVHAFQHQFVPPLTEAERDLVEVRPVATGTPLLHAPELRTQWQPIAHLAMDIVNNCNLRCPFCVVDYAGTKTTRFMADETFDAALKLIPYVTDGNFWLSCLHEATLHPRLLDFIDRVPREYRRKLFYTTNLAKRMPNEYFAALGDSGLHHLNISIESLDPAVYEKMRAGARFPIFLENWDKLLAHHAAGKAPPSLRYNIMCYRSNVREIPALVQTLLDLKRAWQVELRHTYDVAHIPQSFRQEEYLTTAEWAELKAAMSHHDPEQVLLLMPPAERGWTETSGPPAAAETGDDSQFTPWLPEEDRAWNLAPRPFNVSMAWNGLLRVYGWKPVGEGEPDRFITYAKTNIHFLRDPLAFLSSL